VKRWNIAAGLLAGCVVMAWTGAARADNWPSWRGPERNGICRETGLPVKWSVTENVAWTLPMPGMGGSTPVVWGDRIFLTSAEKNNTVLMCISTDGKTLWKKTVGTPQKMYQKDEGNNASASPSTDGKYVWCYVASGELSCFDFDGNQVWSFNVQDRYGKFSIYHGIHNSPVVYEDRLYLLLLHSNAHWLVAMDKTTGKEIWKFHRKTDAKGESPQAYTTPCLWQEGKEMCLVVVGCDYATCHRLTDGSEVWRLSGLNPKASTSHRIITSPVAVDDVLVLPTCRELLVFAMKPGARGNIAPGHANELWQKAKGAPDVPTPVIYDGLLYLCGADGFLTCWDARTGKSHYDHQRLHPSRYRASPVYADGKLYLTSRDGNFTVVKTGTEFKVLATNTLPDEFTASPAISNGRIYLRGFETLYAIQAKK
jgi:outer membrane protein assembly factor BamB